MRIIRNALVALVVLIAVLAIIGLFLPSTVHVERTTEIDAPPGVVFGLINNHREFNRWSPWADIDPNTQYVFEGPVEGVGAKMIWRSEHSQVGSGSSEITESRPNELLRNHLDFGKQGVADAFFRLEDIPTGTRATWGFDTDFGYNLIGRYMGLFFDDWVGADYEKGLARLKALAEREAA